MMAVTDKLKSPRLQAAVVFAVSFIIYAVSIGNGFVYDDEFLIVENPWIKDARHIPDMFLSDSWGFMETASNYYRPVMLLFYMADYHIFGLEPWGFHLSYVLLHSAVSVALLFFTTALMGSVMGKNGGNPGRRGGPGYIPIVAALIFATHPVHTQVVAWNGVHEMSLTLFSLLAATCFMKGRRAAALVFFFIAALSKETAAVLPILLFSYDLAVNRPEYFPLGAGAVKRLARRYGPFVAVGVAYIAIRSYAIGGFAPTTRHAELGATDYLMNIPPLFAKYLYMLISPTALTPTHVFHPVQTLLTAAGLISVAVLAGFVASLFITRKRNPVIFVCLAWIGAPLLPVMYIPAMGIHVFAENYLYMPSVGFSLIVAIGAAKLYTVGKRGPVAAAVAATLLLSVYSAATVKRSAVWRSEMTLWTDTVKKSPDSFLAWQNLGHAYYDASMFDEAETSYKQSLTINPDFALTRNNLGNAYIATGRLDEAIKELRTAAMLDDDYPDPHYNLGIAYHAMGMNAEAVAAYRKALSLDPESADTLNNLGLVYFDSGDYKRAADLYLRATEVDGEKASARNNLGNAYAVLGRWDDAEAALREARRLDPTISETLFNLSLVYLKGGKRAEAEEAMGEYLRMRPDDAEAARIMESIRSGREGAVRCGAEGRGSNSPLPAPPPA